jgi:hypothetical protein
VFLVYTLTIGLIAGLYQIRGVPLVNRFLWTLAMLLQVYVPAWLIQRQNQTLSVYGLHAKGWMKSLQLWVLCCLVFFPPTILGHHIWQQWNGFHIKKQGSYKKFSYDLRGTPTTGSNPNHVFWYADQTGGTLTMRWRAPLNATIKSERPILVRHGNQWLVGPRSGNVLHVAGGGFTQDATIQFALTGRSLSYTLKRHGRPIPARNIYHGPQATTAPPSYTFFRDYWWLIYLVIMQCFMVALPEELFYRGYMQTRLDAVFPIHYKWGIPLSWGNLLVSILFALTHFLIGFEPHRLSVFFPSLVFGALRHRTGSLLAPILFHACSNIFVKLLELWYF